MNWVQVRHRLPEENKQVLLGWPDQNCDIAYHQKGIFRYYDYDFRSFREYDEQPTHWCYLPEVPK